jgi:hypothetical protein
MQMMHCSTSSGVVLFPVAVEVDAVAGFAEEFPFPLEFPLVLAFDADVGVAVLLLIKVRQL